MRWSLMLVVMLAGCAGPVADDGGDDPGDGPGGIAAPDTYTWRSDATGRLVHEVSLISGGGWCDVLVAAAGASPDHGATMVGIISHGDDRRLSIGSGQGSIGATHASVQVLGNEEHVAGGRAWADDVASNRTTERGELVNITLAAVRLDGSQAPSWAHPALDGASAVMQVRCERPFELVHAFHGDEVVVFSETTFSGGASAHAHGLGETGAQAANSVHLTVEDRGWLYLDHRGDLLLQHIAAGAITIRTPAGEQVVLDHPAALALAIAGVNPLQYEVEAGAGDYEVEITYASVDILGDVKGFIIGRGPAPVTPPPIPPPQPL